MLQKYFYPFLIISIFLMGVSSNKALSENNEAAQQIITADNTTIVSQETFLKLQQTFNSAESIDSSVTQNPSDASLHYYPMWYCVSQPYYSNAWYYWYSTNLDYARYRALNACTSNHGYNCYVNCRITY
ncbi:MAG: hypothetical protein HQ462_08220 [Deltaproteobacteria bacterium]|nr:hypothetical protein [Deltaproteobacteria bacterium]